MTKKIKLNTDKILKIAKTFADLITEEAKKKLLSEMKNRDKEVEGRGQISMNLYQSIQALIRATSTTMDVGIKFDDYGVFIDKGVKGSDSFYPQSKNSPFQFSSKMPPTKVFSGAQGWISRKAIIDRGEVRAKTGLTKKLLSQQVNKLNRRLAYVIAKSVKEKGIKAYHFSDVLNNYIAPLNEAVGNEVGEELAIFVIEEIKNAIKERGGKDGLDIDIRI